MTVHEAGRGAPRRPAQAGRTARGHGRYVGIWFVFATVGRAIAALERDHDKFVQSRLTALQFWKERARALEPELEAFRATLPCHLSCTVGRLHLPLLKEMLEASKHGDKALVDDLIHGFKVAGEMDAGGLGKSQDGGIKRG